MAGDGRHRVLDVFRDGCSRLLRVGLPGRSALAGRPAVLIVASPLQPWTLLDLRPGSSLVGALASAGLDVFVLDWGRFGDADRHLDWDALVGRVTRMKRVTRRLSGAPIVLAGVSLGATLATVAAAHSPRDVAALTSIVGPIDFTNGGVFGRWCDPRYVDADVVADAGNLPAWTLRASVIVASPFHAARGFAGLLSRDPEVRSAARDIQRWAADGIPLPAEAYRVWMRDFYQGNALVAGDHRVAGRRIALGEIRCPVLVVTAEDDGICPPASALALCDHVGSDVLDVLSIPGGHVSGLVGPTAPAALYRPLADWLLARRVGVSPGPARAS